MTLKNKAIKGMSWTAGDVVVNQLGMLFIMAYLARVLGPSSFGLIGMLAVFIAIAQSLINSGFSQALIQRGKFASDKDFSTAFIVNLGVSLILYLILYFAAPFIADFYNEKVLIEVSRVLFLILIINALSVVAVAKLAIKLDFKSVAFANTSSTVLGSVIGILLAKEGFDYWSLVVMQLVKAGVNVALLWWFCRWLPLAGFSMTSCRRLFGFGSKLLVAGILAQVVNNLYILLTGRYFSATQVGYLTQSTQLTERASGVINTVLQKVTYPVMTSVNSDRNRMVAIYKQMIEASMIVALPALSGFAMIADPFVRLFLGSEWTPIIPVIVILCFARAITPISIINLNALNAVGRSDLFLKTDLAKLPMTLLAVFIAAPHGVQAIAWAMLVTSAISFFINAYYPGKLFGFGAWPQLKIAWKLLISTAVMIGGISLINHPNLALEIFLKIISGILIYGCMLGLLKVRIFTNNLRMVFEKILEKIR